MYHLYSCALERTGRNNQRKTIKSALNHLEDQTVPMFLFQSEGICFSVFGYRFMQQFSDLGKDGVSNFNCFLMTSELSILCSDLVTHSKFEGI